MRLTLAHLAQISPRADDVPLLGFGSPIPPLPVPIVLLTPCALLRRIVLSCGGGGAGMDVASAGETRVQAPWCLLILVRMCELLLLVWVL